ncbi:hypothetical protein F4818DRAFT_408520 [Hypoxylon cercidicola]|nr:hypothetical protein F4818DRAFT_408520 [Hypoxylon cercidicola]
MPDTMATSKQDPLQVLNQVFNEVLVQTGKHIAKNPVVAASTIRAKTSDSMTAYHYALDDLESEITRAKAVILRDLEKLRAARAPPPAPVPAPQPAAPPAPMMDLPSSAAHTMTAPAFAPKQESKTAAPFPDMGMGMSADIIDLTSSEKKPSPRTPANIVRPPPRPNYPVKPEAKPSPKQASKPTPKLSQPPKVTPVPPPQIPRLQAPQQPPTQPQPTARATPVMPPAQPAHEPTPNATTMGGNAAGGDAGSSGGNALHFTDMQFSLAPSTAEAQGAPPAPMPEFDLTTFAPQDGSHDMMSLDSRPNNNNNAGAASASTAAAPQQQPQQQDKSDTNLDDLFNLDANNDEMDSMFDLGGGVNTFNDMFFDNSTNNDDDMQFDEQFFLQ